MGFLAQRMLLKKQEEQEKKGESLELAREEGAIIPVGELSKYAEKWGVDEGTLMRILEPIQMPLGTPYGGQPVQTPGGMAVGNIPGRPGRTVGYKMPSKTERDITTFRQKTAAIEQMRGQYAQAARTRTEKALLGVGRVEETLEAERAEPKLGREQARLTGVAETQEKIADRFFDSQSGRLLRRQKGEIEQREEMTVQYFDAQLGRAVEQIKRLSKAKEEALTKWEKDKFTADINLTNAHADLYKAQKSYYELGGAQAIKTYEKALKQLELIGAIKDKQFIPLTKKDKRFKQAIAIMESNGIAYDLLSAGKTHWGLGSEQFIISPKISAVTTGVVGEVSLFQKYRDDPRFKNLSDVEIKDIIARHKEEPARKAVTQPVIKPVIEKKPEVTVPRIEQGISIEEMEEIDEVGKTISYEKPRIEKKPKSGMEIESAVKGVIKDLSMKDIKDKSGMEIEEIIRKLFRKHFR